MIPRSLIAADTALLRSSLTTMFFEWENHVNLNALTSSLSLSSD